MWQADWQPRSCTHSALLDVWVGRVFSAYKVEPKARKLDDPIKVVWVDRRKRRRLRDQDAHIRKLRETFPNVKIEVVDLAELSYAQQLKLATETDVLAGIHGAGLTHAMFMARTSSVVEFLPADFHHKGFRNLANLKGQRYFKTHTDLEGDPKKWQTVEEVGLSDDRFQEVMGAAIRSVYNRGYVNQPINEEKQQEKLEDKK